MIGDFSARWGDAMARCSRCGLCLAVCPTFTQTRREPDSPRGQLVLIQAWSQGQLPARAIAPYLAHCALCGRCSRVCPARVPLEQIFFAARRLIPIHWRQLGAFLTLPPSVLDFLQPPAALARRFLPGRSSTIPLARAPYAPPAEQSGDVLFFPGCLGRRLYPRLARLCLEALELCGHKVFTLPSLPCCGRPMAVRGQNIAPLVRRWLKLLHGRSWRYIVTSCPGCLDTFTRLWPSLPDFSVAESQQITALAARCKNLMDILPEVRGWRGDARIYWHRPCLETESADATTRRLLGDYEISSSRAPHCCGAALHCLPPTALETVSQPSRPREPWRQERATPLAETLPLRVYHEALAQGAQMIATTCPGCKWVLNGVKKAGGPALSALHPLEILLERPPRGGQ